MTPTKNYFHDKTVLFLLTVNTFLAVLTSVLIALKLGNGHGQSFTVQYRANLGINAFKFGNTVSILSFIVFCLLVAILHTALSMRVYPFRRNLALAVLWLGLLLLLLSLIISNALLTLR